MTQTLQIACNGADTLPLKDLTVLQGELKSLSEENYEKLKKSMLTQGFSAPLFIWVEQDTKTKFLIDGTQRVRTLQKMEKEGVEIPPLPVAYIHAKDRNEAKRKLLAIVSQFGRVESQGLYEFIVDSDIEIRELQENYHLPEIDFEAFEDEYFEESYGGGLADEDEVPEVNEENIWVKTGDLFQLGEHRLLCADSLVKENLDLLMNHENADIVFTDPPYGINYQGFSSMTGTDYKKFANDDKIFDPAFILNYFNECDEIFMFGGDYFISKEAILSGSLFVWDKRVGDQGRIPGSHFEICWSKKKHQRVILRHQWLGSSASEKNEEKLHLTQKSVAMICDVFDRWAKDRKLVVDPFMGSGSTLMACETTDRRCFGIEIDPFYCQTVLDRWSNFTGKQWEKIT